MALSRDFVKRLGSSTFNYWFGYVANFSLVAWMVSHAFAHGHLLTTIPEALGYSALGLGAWTLTEYGFHRYIYHAIPSFLSVGHDLHHKQPKELIGVPWYLTTVAVIAIFSGLIRMLDPAMVGLVAGFTWLGYIFYCICHHGSHHWSFKNTWFRRMKRNHLLHHAYPEYNWGFTTSVWDSVFRTVWTEDARKQARADKSASPMPKHAA